MGSMMRVAVVLSLMSMGIRGHTLPPVEVTTYSSTTLPSPDSGTDPSTDVNMSSITSTPEQSKSSTDDADCVLGEDEKKKDENYLDRCCKSATPIPEVRSTAEKNTAAPHHKPPSDEVSNSESTASLPDNNSGSTNTIPENTTSSPDKDDCKCVAYYLCEDYNISEDSLIDVHYPVENKCGTFLETCCKSIKPLSEMNTSGSHTQNTTTSLNSCGHREIMLSALPIRVNPPKGEAMYGEFPWMMALLQNDAEGKEVYLCGGSLIHPQVVLTGAHCVYGKKNLLIRAGEWDTQTELEIYPTQDRNVSEIIIHEQYYGKTLANDMALLILDSPVDIKKDEGHIGLICLPEENEDFTGRDCVASGWGKKEFGKEGSYSAILKKVDLPIVPREACLEALRKTRLGSGFILHPSFICAGGVPGIDTCKGDGGSPLVCSSKSHPEVFVQAGIVAWGISCGTETPATYVNVPKFIPWVHSQLQKHGISFSS